MTHPVVDCNGHTLLFVVLVKPCQLTARNQPVDADGRLAKLEQLGATELQLTLADGWRT